ncbi:MAG TPA: hypothetical protein VK171_00005, partial [Fimbriimonas sp.]|nr:hypothetical protein [Fimbriimonas sp.]
GQKLKFHQCSNIDGKELHDAWLLMQRWLGFSQKRLKEILQLAKLWPSEITVAEEEEEVEEDLQSATTSNSSNGNAGGHEVRLRRLGKRRPRRLLSPAVVWSCLHLQSQTAGDRPIITLGGYDERPLWETWYECTDRLHLSVEHLYVPEMMVGSNTLRMAAEQTPIRWLNSRDVLDKFMEQLNAMSWEAATAPGQVIPWCFNGCVRLPQFVRGEALGFKFMMKNVTTLNDLSLVNNSKAIKELAESVWSFYG